MKIQGMALLALGLAAGAEAGTICVSPAGGTCQATIQAAVDIAAPYDRVAVAAGTYYENVTVPPGKDGLQIVGAGKAGTILDPSPFADKGLAGNTGDGLVIQSRNVQVRGFTFRNGRHDGIRIQAANVLVQANNFFGQDDYGVEVDPLPAAFGAQVIGNEFRGVSTAIESNAPGTVVRTNLIADCSVGIDLHSDRAQVVGNRIANGSGGIVVVGAGAVVSANDIRYVLQVGLNVFGNAPTVTRNRLLQAGLGAAVGVDCSNNCAGGTVAYNVVSESGLGSYGLFVQSDDAGLTINNNTLLRAGGAGGMVILGQGHHAYLNTVTDPGMGFDADCVQVNGDYNVVARNTVRGCPASGIYVSGDGNYLDRNVAFGTLENGFAIDGYVDGVAHHRDNALYANRSTGAAGQGVAILNGAQDTYLLSNVAQSSRTDACDEGTNTVFVANTFGTSTATCAIVH